MKIAKYELNRRTMLLGVFGAAGGAIVPVIAELRAVPPPVPAETIRPE